MPPSFQHELCYQNFVNGQYLSNQSGEKFDVINPATGQVIYQVEVADAFIQQRAIDSAQKGFEKEGNRANRKFQARS